ncbi:PD-(D/E)XK nuclease-like domain-containing protein [Enterobacter hormaechei subsp. xiangfangensis]|uniref:RecE family exodeoxyribonuclease n=1 Tax=Enterobacter hormaechei TaxID=158836 RepID=UPI0022362E7F|nr:RecE family exodeoxyribonuclease [Enterobacter hormaechei]MCW4687934.1 PD-(D/E)XK nuclease-like domain-containing protein [Enterobacter hormaechei subsp. xiangfangensis]MCW4789555.1 PD-(D/E)XK nuclease-like domain-containing protein [Enterobacter hormaechei subsp. xiangfangensis]MCW4817908.1 PD-(D/E)XK nuclease-like domain-containing protein [Enterobacter hormaechei subsp. xiangfangensis]MCW4939264.1 PD-(D/E)XK nuclease-like domain-containing protein [Enterobacter hormaechei subsp. xiangfang
MEFFHLLKASQKSGKKDAVIWFTAKSAARANLQLDVALEEAGIEETGRGKDYAKPIRTDFPVYNDLPEEGTVDYTWCERYALQDDGRTWLPKAGAESTGSVDNTAAPETTVKVETIDESVTLENRTPAARFAFHLTSDKYQTHISKEQQLAASEMSLDEGNTYLQNLLLAKNDTPEVAELSLNAEWKLVQAIKQVFAPDEEHEVKLLAAFMADWLRVDAGDRNEVVREWRSGKLTLLKSERTSGAGVETGQHIATDDGIQIGEHDDENTRYPVCRMPFRKQLLSQFTADELRHHVTREQYEAISALEMDTDNSYVQNLLLAAENCEEIKGYDTKDLWRYTDAIRKVFSQEKRHELALVLRFTKIWAETDYIDRGILAREWAAGNRISSVQRTDSGTNADGGYVTDRGEGAHHTMDTLDLEIACALLPMDFHHFEIPSSVLRRAKEIVAKREEPWKSWSAILRNQPGVLSVNRAAIFNVIRIAPENIHHTPVAHLEFVNKTMTAEFNSAVELLPLSEPVVEVEAQATQPKVENLGGGIFSIDALLGGTTDPVINTSSNEVQKTENAAETTSDVQMETTQPEKVENTDPVQPGESADAADTQTVTVAPAEILAAAAPSLTNQEQAGDHQKTDSVIQKKPEPAQSEPESAQNEPAVHQEQPAVEYPAYFEPGRYEGLPNEVYHAANGISSTQVKDARVSLMYFNARHVEKTIVKERSAVLDMGNLVHALALQPEQLDAEFSIEPAIPEGAFTTAATLRAFIDEYNASLPALLSADDIKVLLEQYNATLPAQVPLGASLEETAQNYMALPADFQRIDADQKQTATAMKACIKEYNATLPPQVKTSGSRDALLEQLAIINPDLVAQEAQKPQPLKVSGTKADLIQAVKAVKPDAVFADELLDAWRDNPEGKVLVTRQQLSTALNIQKALLAHPTAGMLLTHPSRAVEVSYFGFDEETGLEVRVRPDLEIDLDGVRIGADLKTISMWNVKQESLRARLHREIIERDYHLSAAMYCETAALDQFFWIFVNKDENYHWIAIIEASAELLELGMLEYRKAMRAIATGFDTGEWPAPITADYTDELNDFDQRRLEALRTQA